MLAPRCAPLQAFRVLLSYYFHAFHIFDLNTTDYKIGRSWYETMKGKTRKWNYERQNQKVKQWLAYDFRAKKLGAREKQVHDHNP